MYKVSFEQGSDFSAEIGLGKSATTVHVLKPGTPEWPERRNGRNAGILKPGMPERRRCIFWSDLDLLEIY